MYDKPLALLGLLALAAPALSSGQSAAPDTTERGSVEEIARATTETRFLSPWVAYLPASATVVSPRAYLHRIPGAAGELVNSQTAYAYCRALAQSSPRARLFTIGRSEEGREIVMLAIADEAGIADLERLKAATAALADPRRTGAAAARQIVANARPIYYFNAALHSDETGSTESVLELAYRLAVSEQPMIRRIRESLVVLINPVSNPDGRDKQVEWFYRFLKGKTDLATLPRQAPPNWSKYAFVDINRDAHQQVHETTRAVFHMFREWHPQVIHDLHESIALLVTWNGTGPINEHVDPLTYAERLELSFHEVQTLTALGMPGVWTWNFGDAFAHLYLDAIASNHNADGRGHETFGNGTAETLVPDQPENHPSAEWSRPLPPPAQKSFTWAAGGDVTYNETAMVAAPADDDVSWELPAHYHPAAIATADPAVRGTQLTALGEAPRPRGQVLGEGPVYLLADTGQEGLLEARYRLARFRVGIAERAFTVNGSAYPAGSWILAPQSGLAAALTQTAETLGLDFASTRSAPEVASHAAPAPRLGLWVPWADTDTIGWARYTLDQRHIPYIYVRDEDIRAGRLRDKYDVLLYGHVDLELAEQIQGIPRAWGPMPFKKTRATPSLGTPAESDDITGGIGWSGVAELQRFVDSGGLLITLGNGSMLPLESGIVRGVRRESGGVPRSTQGGGAAAAAASQSSVTRTPGAHVRVSFARPDHPIAYGYGARTYVFRQNFARYSIPRRWLRMAYCTTCLDGPLDTSAVVLEWGDREGAPFVVSGQAWGEENLIGHPAILDLRSGAGHVIAFNFNPLHRDLNRGDQRLLWNAIINWRAILAAH